MQNTHSKAKDEGEACIINQASKSLQYQDIMWYLRPPSSLLFCWLLQNSMQYVTTMYHTKSLIQHCEREASYVCILSGQKFTKSAKVDFTSF